MADDGSFKGHGGKPGRKSTVLSMSAHKNRHAAEGDPAGKKVSALTLFDFSPSESVTDDAPPTAVIFERSASAPLPRNSEEALPCENTPFERDSFISQQNNVGKQSTFGQPTNEGHRPGRKFLRWGLEEGGQAGLESSPLTVRDIFADNLPPGDLDDDEYFQAVLKERNRERWQQKATRSGSVIESFYHAIHGLKVGFATQRNVRIHCGIALVMTVLAIALKVDAVSWLALILATGFVFFAEFLNTAVEYVTDIQANFRYHPSARYAKDTAAAAVLVAALTAVLVGTFVFAPRLYALICALCQGTV
jgi:diacylglycerol kinase